MCSMSDVSLALSFVISGEELSRRSLLVPLDFVYRPCQKFDVGFVFFGCGFCVGRTRSGQELERWRQSLQRGSLVDALDSTSTW